MTSFIKKYQRPLFLIMAVFALLTFSITPAMREITAMFTGTQVKLGTITLPDGRDYDITREDWKVATDLHRVFKQQNPLISYFIKLELGELTEEELKEERENQKEAEKKPNPRYLDRLLLLYCLAKESGLELTDAPVIKFTQNAISSRYLGITDKKSYRSMIPRIFGVGVIYFERLLQEFARIELYRDCLCMGENTAIASVIEAACKEGKEYNLEVVRFSADEFKKAVEQEKVTDKQLIDFLGELELGEKRDFVDAKVMQLTLAHLPLDTTLEALKKSVVDNKPKKDTPGAVFLKYLEDIPEQKENDLKAVYERDKGSLYKVKKVDLDTPVKEDLAKKKITANFSDGFSFADALKQFTLLTSIQAEISKAANETLAKADNKVQIKDDVPLVAADFLSKLTAVHPDLAYRVKDGKVVIYDIKKEHATDEPQVEYIPFAEVKDKIATQIKFKQALEIINGEVLDGAEKEKFEFKAFMKEHFPLFKLEETPLKNLGDLLAKGTLKNWPRSIEADAAASGDMLENVYRSDNAWFMAQLVKVAENVALPIHKIRKELRLVYNAKEEKTRAKQAADDFFAALKEKGAKAQPKKISEIDKEIQEAVEERLAYFTKNLEKGIKKANEIMADSNAHPKVKQHWEKSLVQLQKDKKALPEKKKKILAEEKDKREADIDEVSLEKAGSFFTETASAKKIKIHKSGFFPGNMHTIDADFVAEKKDEAIKYAMGNQGIEEIKEFDNGQITKVIEDLTNKAYLIIKLVDQRNRAVGDLTPGEVKQAVDKHTSGIEQDFSRSFLDFKTLKAFVNYRGYSNEEEEGTKDGTALKTEPGTVDKVEDKQEDKEKKAKE